MVNLIWSIGLAVVGITGLWLAGSQHRLGWAIGLAAQLAWLTFGIVSGQYGFVATAIAYGFVYARNLLADDRRELHRILRRQATATADDVAAGLADVTIWSEAEWRQVIGLATRTPSLAALIGDDLANSDLG